jgi:hypothetical protein
LLASVRLCVVCTHFDRNPRRRSLTCDAFPKSIPGAILENSVDHRIPYGDDHGITFEATDSPHASGIIATVDLIIALGGYATSGRHRVQTGFLGT